MTRMAPDHDVRLRALDSRGSFILEAPAGSGKTDLLTARFLVLLADVASPRQILALTYTRKAANQMQSRILDVLERARTGAEPKNDWDAYMLDLGRKALANDRIAPDTLRNPDAYRVGTFHGFCASVVRGWPLEAGVPPGAGILEDLEQDDAINAAVLELFGDVAAGRAPELRPAFERRLASANNRPDALSGQISALLKGRDKLDLFRRAMADASVDLADHVKDILERHAQDVLAPARAYFLDRAARWRELKETLEAGGAPKAERLADDVPPSGLAGLTAWKDAADVFLTGGGTPYRSFTERSGFYKGFGTTESADFVKTLPADVAEALATVRGWPSAGDDPADLPALADVLMLVGAAVERLRARIPGAGLDYLELESAALRSLEWGGVPSESLIFFSEHLRHVLVDEAQDMNDVQVTILSRLCEGWEPGDGRTLFVVGDPKQSIYRFRRADVALFTQLKARGLVRPDEPAYPLQPLELTANFRSEPGLVAFCNALFERIMADPNPDNDEVAFQASEPGLPASPEAFSIEMAVFHQERDEDGAPAGGPPPRTREAAYVAGRIANLHTARPDASIALLFPARTALSTYLSALSALKVPLKLVEGEDLAERPEVRHLSNLFTALARPYDDVAWAGTLRAPWSRHPASEILRLAGGTGPWRQRILAESGEDTPVSPLAEKLAAALEAFGREPYEATLGRLWEDLGGPAATASYYGAAGVANARAFLALLPACAGLPAEEALQKVDRMLDKAYTPPDPRGAFSPVSVMTVHKAKGLEFDHVFAVNLDRNPGGGARNESPGLRMARMPGRGRPILIAPAPDARTRARSLAYQVLEELDAKRELAESRRLLYVAATRARRSLTLTGVASLTRDSVLKARHDASALGRLWSVLLEAGEFAPADRFGRLGLRCPAPNPAPPPAPVIAVAAPAPVTPPPFEAQRLPYKVASPSEVEEETAQAALFGAEEERDPHARARGIVAHRLFELLARGRNLPAAEAVASALASEGLPLGEAPGEASDLLAETVAAWSLAEFAALREGAQAVLPEYALEDFDGLDRLRVGRLDLLVESGGRFAVVDYKTGRPDGDVEAWIEARRTHYAPQLRAYAEMVARSRGVDAGSVKSYLLFTGPRRLVEL